MFTIMDALRDMLDYNLTLIAKYADDLPLKSGFYMQVFGAVSMLTLTSYEEEARALWEEYEPRYKAAVWGA